MPNVKNIADIKANLLHPALTSHFEVKIAKGRDMRKAIEASSKKRKGKPTLNKGCEYPQFQKGGKIISKEGKIVEFDCISHISRELNLDPSHLGQVLSGKRKSHKGWKNAA